MYGLAGNYAAALYSAGKKAKDLNKITEDIAQVGQHRNMAGNIQVQPAGKVASRHSHRFGWQAFCISSGLSIFGNADRSQTKASMKGTISSPLNEKSLLRIAFCADFRHSQRQLAIQFLLEGSHSS